MYPARAWREKVLWLRAQRECVLTLMRKSFSHVLV